MIDSKSKYHQGLSLYVRSCLQQSPVRPLLLPDLRSLALCIKSNAHYTLESTHVRRRKNGFKIIQSIGFDSQREKESTHNGIISSISHLSDEIAMREKGRRKMTGSPFNTRRSMMMILLPTFFTYSRFKSLTNLTCSITPPLKI